MEIKLVEMADWITCTNCGYRFGAFMRACPKCKISTSHNSYATTSRVQSKEILRGKRKIILSYIIIGIIISSGISFFVLPSLIAPQPSISDLKIYALKTINEDRTKFGLPPVKLDDNNGAAQAQANELFKTQRLSHWTIDGMKPYMRYSVYGGKDNVVQNVAQEKYGFASLSMLGNNDQQASSDLFDQARLAACKMGIALCDNLVDSYNAIGNLEYSMVYDDENCCQNGHRTNILDTHHTHVSIGIAYDKFYLALVQNFEDKYTIWNKPISYSNKSNMVSMNGTLKNNADAFDGITISYDPLPSQATYKQNITSESYSEGETVAEVAPPNVARLQGDFQSNPDNGHLIEAAKWIMSDRTHIADSNSGNNNITSFAISFPMHKLTKVYGTGVYTIDTWYNDTNNKPFQASSISLFIR
jgi:uncharacterized protein YkwD